MSIRSADNDTISGDASSGSPTGGRASPRAPAEQLAMNNLQRVRALERATRCANGSGYCPVERQSGRRRGNRLTCGGSGRRTPGQIAADGPGPLTEERQKPECHRSEEHTSELQSPDHLVCRLLLEK